MDMNSLVLASVLGDAWRWGVTVVVLVGLIFIWYYMMDKLGSF